MADKRDFELRLREALQHETDSLPLRVDAMTVRERLDSRSRLPSWLLPVILPVAAAIVVGVVLVNAFPGPTDDLGAADATAGATDMPTTAPSFGPTAQPAPGPTPHPLFGQRRAAAYGNGWTYLVGGQSGASAVSSVAAFNGLTWSDLPSLPEGRAGAGAAALPDGRLIAFGGEIDGVATDSTLVLEPGADAWVVAEPMPHPQADMAVVELNGRAYLFGGSTGLATDVLVFDTNGGGWTLVQPLPFALGEVAATALGNAIYVLGTPLPSDDVASDQAAATAMLRYDPEANAWTVLARAPISGPPISAAAAGGRIWAIGRAGALPADQPRPSTGSEFVGPDRRGVAFYDPEADEWTLSDQPLPPAGSTQIVIPSERQLVVIGSGGGGITTTVVDIQAP